MHRRRCFIPDANFDSEEWELKEVAYEDEFCCETYSRTFGSVRFVYGKSCKDYR
jgi:hypothetical protein